MKAQTSWVLALAGDLPFVSLEALRFLWERRTNADVVVPVAAGSRFEPLHTFYRAGQCAASFGVALESGGCSFARLFEGVRTLGVPVDQLRPIDSALATLENVNTWADVERLGLSLPDPGIAY